MITFNKNTVYTRLKDLEKSQAKRYLIIIIIAVTTSFILMIFGDFVPPQIFKVFVSPLITIFTVFSLNIQDTTSHKKELLLIDEIGKLRKIKYKEHLN